MDWVTAVFVYLIAGECCTVISLTTGLIGYSIEQAKRKYVSVPPAAVFLFAVSITLFWPAFIMLVLNALVRNIVATRRG